MRSRNLARFAILLLGISLLALACGDGDVSERSVEGVLLQVEAVSLTETASFTLLADDAEVLEFQIAPDAASDSLEGFFPGHLREHALATQLVTVIYREESGRLLALRLEHE